MRIVILETDLFPDRQTVEGAVAWLKEDLAAHCLSRHDVRGHTLTEEECDVLLDAILTADLVVTV
ncbi:MAG: hypothetical protein ACYCTF_13580 [Acidiferrobacter sp.]